MSNRTSLRMRVLPRFPARITGTNGLTVVQDNLDLVIKPDFGALVPVPSVQNPTKTFFLAWESDLDSYSSISFQNLVENIQDVIIGPTTAAMEATSPTTDQFIYFTGTDVAATTGLTAAGRALLDDANAAAQRATLGLGTSATTNVGTTSGTVASGDDSRIVGAAQKSANLSDLANAATARTNLGLGTAATQASTAFATAAQGVKADAALPAADVIKDTGHYFVWGNRGGAGWDGVSDFQAGFFQNQTDFLTNGSTGALYGQRLNTYAGGANGDSVTPACGAVRGYNQISATVTYSNESGGLFVTDNYGWLPQAVGVFGQANSRKGGRTFGLEAEAIEHPELQTPLNGTTVLVVPNNFVAGAQSVIKNGAVLVSGVGYNVSAKPASDQTGTISSISGTGTVVTVAFSGAFTPPVGYSVDVVGVTPSVYNGRWRVLTSSSGNATLGAPGTGTMTVAGTLQVKTALAGSITLTTPANGADAFKINRGDPEFAASGGEVIIYAAGGTDNRNTLSGNRIGLSIFGWRNGTETVSTNIGTLLNLVCNPNDASLKIDRGINAQGRFDRLIDFSSANLVVDTYIAKLSSAGAGIDKNLNMSIGSFAPTVLAGITSMKVGNASNGGVYFVTDGTATGRLQASAGGAVVIGSDTNHDVIVNVNGAEKWRIPAASGAFRPSADNLYALGSASFRTSVVYSATAAINTSDERLKTGIRDLSAAERKVAKAVKKLVKAYQFKDSVAEKGDDARVHFGVIAQEVEAAFAAEGLDAWRYGIMCSDPVMAMRETTVTRIVQKTEKTIRQETVVEVIDGVAIQGIREVEDFVLLWQDFDLHDDVGNVIMDPVYEAREVDIEGPEGTQRVTKKVQTGEAPAKHRTPMMVEEELPSTEEYDTGETRLGIRYTELLCFIMAA